MSKKFSTVCGFIFVVSVLATTLMQAQTDTIRVVCVGNSITEGSNATSPSTDNYPAQLGALLGSGYTVLNAGVSGRTLMRSGDYPIWNEQKFKNGLNFSPDIVTISLGTNDTKPYNWDAHQDEFIPDYYAMVDTFKSLPSHPQIWVCLPPPSFSDAYDIRDSIINADIIPMVDSVAKMKDCEIIDFNTLMKDKSNLVPDGIHPNTIGYTLMAEYIYTRLTGKSVTRVRDENCAAGKTVNVSGSIDPILYGGAKLVDRDRTTLWIATGGFPYVITIDLNSSQIIDQFGIDFGSTQASGVGYQFKIESSETNDSWTPVINRTARTDTATAVVEKTDSITARYVRITITGAVHPKEDTVTVAEVRVMKANGGIHSPYLSAKRSMGTSSGTRYDINLLWPNGAHGAVMWYRWSSQYGLSTLFGFVKGANWTKSDFIRTVNYNAYYTVTFSDGVETVSDTMYLGAVPTAVERPQSSNIPRSNALMPAYPDPFNPTTTIEFSLLERSDVHLVLVNVLGQVVKEIANGNYTAGNHRVTLDASRLASGIYFYKMQARQTYGGDLFTDTKKLVFMK